MARQIVVMGSGETSPTMVTPHQKIVAQSPISKENPAIFLDTPFGFQENVDDLTQRQVDYFAQSVGLSAAPVQLRNRYVSSGELAHRLATIRSAAWLFAGPGSPTYALSVWRELGVTAHFDEILTRGSVIFASAAALTVGSHTMPVYEMYKVGQEPQWFEGLNLLARHTGLPAAIVPHFDNAEGGNHDTRFCYIGENRMKVLESQLPEDHFVIGVDEHTGVAFDLDTRIASVFGRGTMTIRHQGNNWVVPSGSQATFDEIIAHTGTGIFQAEPAADFVVDARKVEHLMDSGDVLSAVDELLRLDELDRDLETRATVHALISRLGHLAASPRVDLQTVVGPYIEALLQARNSARSGGRWDEADSIRDQLTSLHVTIKDTADGSQWEIQSS